jgi:Ca2+-binding RTX toxin-like protein
VGLFTSFLLGIGISNTNSDQINFAHNYTNRRFLMALIIGDNNDNQLIGTLDADLIRGLDGSDRIRARGGDDTVQAGSGDDNVRGQSGNDTIRGNGGDDNLNGNGGDDRVVGGAGDDRMKGGSGADRLIGGSGNDRIRGGSGADILSGGSGDDRLRGGDDDDLLRGGAGDDLLIGDTGDDTMRGGAGDDRMVWNPGDGSDIMRGGSGIDTAIANGGGIDETFTLKQQGRRALFDRVDPFPFTLDIKSTEVVELNGFGGNDSFEIEDLSNTSVTQVLFNGGEGNDTLDATASSTAIEALGGDGNDVLLGGSAIDTFDAGAGNDTVVGQRGDDIADLGEGDDRFIWNNGDGSDFINGGAGFDVTQVNGADGAGDEFDLTEVDGQAIFNRLNLGLFTLTNENIEQFEINGQGGDDSLVVSDVTSTDIALVVFNGGDGNDTLDAANGGVSVEANGGAGDDTLTGGSADDFLSGGLGTNLLTGGAGSDRFAFGADGRDATDTITDYSITEDQHVLVGAELGIDELLFQKVDLGVEIIKAAKVELIEEVAVTPNNSNALILQGRTFANAGAAAQAIANNNQITAEEGVFVYFNENLGFARLVYSENLGAGGNIDVLANMESITDVADIAGFTADNFVLA